MTVSPNSEVLAARQREYDSLESVHGGYWRHDFVDHAYLYNLYFPPDSLIERLGAGLRELVLNYPVAQDAVAALVGDLIGQPPERVIVGNGAAELIKIISGGIANRLIVPVPSFNEYANAAPDGVVVEFALNAPGFELDVDAFAAEAARVGADFAVVVTPNNPTSLCVSRRDLLRLATILEPIDCTLVVDESFIDFADASASESLERDVAEHLNLMVIKSMSKAYGICGLRIGYLVTANEDLALRVRRGLHIWNINGFAEEFLRMAREYRQDFVESCERVRIDRDRFYEALLGIEGLTVHRPQANFLFCRLPERAPSGAEVERRLFVEHHIYVKHCGGKTMGDADRYLRIASRTEAENQALVAALSIVLNSGDGA